MKRKMNSVLPVIGVMTLVLILIAQISSKTGTEPVNPAELIEEEEPERWLLAPRESVPVMASGFSGLLFSADNIYETDAAFFRPEKENDEGIRYAYVPAEMNGQLYVFFGEGQSLEIEGDGVSGTFASGDLLPVFSEKEEYVFTLRTEETETASEDSGDGEGAAGGDAEGGEAASGGDAEGGEDAAGGNGEGGEDAAGGDAGSREESSRIVFLYSENVPSMYIETKSGSMDAVNGDKNHETAEMAAYRIYLTDGEQDSSGTCAIKGRGNSTWSLAKKPYNLNLEEDNSLLGIERCSRLALIANFWDSTQTRQYYAYLAAERLGLAYTPQTQFVNVYLNGYYHSICLLTQRINVKGGSVRITDLDKQNKMLNADSDTPDTLVMETDEEGNEALAFDFKREPEDITGGYLIEFDDRYEKEDYWFTTQTRHMVFKSPQSPSVGEYQYISDYVREAEKALYSGVETDEKGEAPDGAPSPDGVNPDTGKTVWEYFDMDSWARMYLIQDFFVQSDDEFYSFYFYKEAGDPLLYCGPVWDFDLCLGNMNCGDYYKTSAQTLWLRDGRRRWLHQMDQFPEFRERVAQIYLEELEPIIRDIMENEYDQTVDRLEKDTNLHYLRWGKNLDYRERTGLVKTLLESRVQFMHDYYSDPDSFCRLLFHFAWGDFSYYVKKGESMGFLPIYDYGEKQSTTQREANGFITAWQDTETGEWLQAETPIYEDREFDPVYLEE